MPFQALLATRHKAVEGHAVGQGLENGGLIGITKKMMGISWKILVEPSRMGTSCLAHERFDGYRRTGDPVPTNHGSNDLAEGPTLVPKQNRPTSERSQKKRKVDDEFT